MPKMKTKSGAKKRFIVRGSGSIKLRLMLGWHGKEGIIPALAVACLARTR